MRLLALGTHYTGITSFPGSLNRVQSLRYLWFEGPDGPVLARRDD